MASDRAYQAVVIGVSAGGMAALERVLPRLAADFSLPVLIVQHVGPVSDSYLPIHFSMRCALPVYEAEDKQPIEAGAIYFAPPNYHLMVERTHTLALSTDDRVNFSRPAVDVLFDTAADAYGPGLVGVILTGSNSDGAAGMARIKRRGGLLVVQTPESAEAPQMPLAVLERVEVDHQLPLSEIGHFLNSLSNE
ncbi:chemotaxis protein CheB [Ferrimonas sediminicola]|uniref:protein-glutamate methylesterase n=1 Tax=Ferrimonas sediminicola TaxID=2569538 RepID=A0A4U1BE61_9GAMM|nr:chemotaxis protein CheB [Ferrimonas sediminicola]TKB48614.1 chemotaxis protein CheB [Ferrimonas sediminicola]